VLESVPAWDGNWTGVFAGFCLAKFQPERLLVAVNYAPNQSQCCVRIPSPTRAIIAGGLTDLLGDSRYDRDGNDLESRGL
jgi:hypothetical protein